jgi:DNA-binding CsgD family transcriptional regulator
VFALPYANQKWKIKIKRRENVEKIRMKIKYNAEIAKLLKISRISIYYIRTSADSGLSLK